jgi:3-oxoacyl-[acyl-carrier-protein] synthase I
MKKVFAISDNIISPLGATTAANFNAVKSGISGVGKVDDKSIAGASFYASALAKHDKAGKGIYTPFEHLCIRSIEDALAGTAVSLVNGDTIFILSTTKGNIALLENEQLTEKVRDRIALQHTAKNIGAYFNAVNTPLAVSNACISGVLAIMVGRRLLQSGKFKHAVITGADLLSNFVVAGFEALHATSHLPCRPFDKARKGINLGEGAATIVLTTNEQLAGGQKLIVHEGASSNDANHISGPSRTGDELAQAIRFTMHGSHMHVNDLAFISAHGTATVYNDEMESKAFETAGLSHVPLHSLKGNYGHTLGAAGVIESVLTIQSLKEGVILPSINYNEKGVSGNVNVNKELMHTGKKNALKTASGFGGCNAAILYSLLN